MLNLLTQESALGSIHQIIFIKLLELFRRYIAKLKLSRKLFEKLIGEWLKVMKISFKNQRLQGRSRVQTQSFIMNDFKGHFNNYLWQDLSRIHYKIPRADFVFSYIQTSYKIEATHQMQNK